MGFSRDKLIKALSYGYELLTSRKFAHLTDLRYCAVVYHLLCDSKRKRERDAILLRDVLSYQNDASTMDTVQKCGTNEIATIFQKPSSTLQQQQMQIASSSSSTSSSAVPSNASQPMLIPTDSASTSPSALSSHLHSVSPQPTPQSTLNTSTNALEMSIPPSSFALHTQQQLLSIMKQSQSLQLTMTSPRFVQGIPIYVLPQALQSFPIDRTASDADLEPQFVMDALYSTLRRLGFDWRVLSLFRVKARWPANLMLPPTSLAASASKLIADPQQLQEPARPAAQTDVVKIGFQLYRAAPVTSNSSTPATLTPHQSASIPIPTNPSPQSSATTTPTSSSNAMASSTSISASHGPLVLDLWRVCGSQFHFAQLSAEVIACLGQLGVLVNV